MYPVKIFGGRVPVSEASKNFVFFFGGGGNVPPLTDRL